MISNNEDRVQKSIKATDEMFDVLNEMPTDTETMTNAFLSSISVHLKDISLSLAVLADLELNKESNHV